MRHSSENDLNALSSWILGITGTSLLLIPFHFNMTGTGIPDWGLSILGIFCYMVALSNQILVCIKVQPEAHPVLSKRISSLPVYFGNIFYSSRIFYRRIHFWFCWDHAIGFDHPIEKQIRTDRPAKFDLCPDRVFKRHLSRNIRQPICAS